MRIDRLAVDRQSDRQNSRRQSLMQFLSMLWEFGDINVNVLAHVLTSEPDEEVIATPEWARAEFDGVNGGLPFVAAV